MLSTNRPDVRLQSTHFAITFHLAAATIELLRLSANTNRRPNLVRPLIERTKQLAPGSAAPCKYSALYNSPPFFQYRTALTNIERFVALRPDDTFGHDMKGFLLHRPGKYEESIDALQKAVELDPEDSYAYIIMARDYTMLARKAAGLDKERFKGKALATQRKAASVALPDA